MKTKHLFISLFIIITGTISAQDIIGDWNGVLKVQGMQMRLVFHVTKTDAGYAATMDSPDQGAKGIPMSKTSFENSIFKTEMAAAQIEYTGKMDSTYQIVGTFKQAGMVIPMNMSRKATEKMVQKRRKNL